MAVDLFDLVETLKREVNPPGYNLFPAATDDTWAGYLEDAFWNARLAGMLSDYTAADGQVVPLSGTTDITRDLQSLIVLFAAISIVTAELRRINTAFKAKAGPVEFEVENSATVLKEVLAELKSRRNFVLARLSDVGVTTDAYIDAVIGRTEALGYGDTWFVG